MDQDTSKAYLQDALTGAASPDVPASAAVARITGLIRAQIGVGILIPGSAAPSVRDIERDYAVSRDIAAASLRRLTEEGMLRSGGHAGYVVEGSERIAAARLYAVRQRTLAFYQELREAGFMPLEIYGAMEEVSDPKAASTPPQNQVEAIFDGLNASTIQSAPGVKAFFDAHPAEKWFIGSDYCVSDKNRLNDVYVYTIYPYDRPIEKLQEEINGALPHDIKKTGSVGDNAIDFLRQTSRLTLAFIVRRGSHLGPRDLNGIRQSIDQTLAMIRAWPNAKQHEEMLRKFEELRTLAKSKNFNRALLSRTSLAALFAAFAFFLITKHGRVNHIGWFPDRDAFTSWAGGIGYELFMANIASFTQRGGAREPQSTFAVYDEHGPTLWYKSLVRVPDFFAGVLAALNLENHGTERQATLFLNEASKKSVVKNKKILGEALVDNPAVAMFTIDLRANAEVRVQQLMLTGKRGKG